MTPEYHAFLLRLQRNESDQWRIQLRDVHNGSRHNFASERDLIVYLMSLFRGVENSEPAKPQLLKEKNNEYNA